MESGYIMSSKLSYEEIKEALCALLDEEHGGCSDNTCAISSCMSHGYHLWAVSLFAGTGAASDEFDRLYRSLPRKRFEREAEKERVEFLDEVDSASCPHCNAIVYEPKEHNYYCSNCGKTALLEVIASCSLPDGVHETTSEEYCNGFRVVKSKYMSENETLFWVAMEYGKDPSDLTVNIMSDSIGSEMPKGAKITIKSDRKAA